MVKYRRTHAAYRDELQAHPAWLPDAFSCGSDWRGNPVIKGCLAENIERMSDWLATQMGEPVKVERCEGFFAVRHLFNKCTISTGLYIEEAAVLALDRKGTPLC